jgi:hypothetical protein
MHAERQHADHRYDAPCAGSLPNRLSSFLKAVRENIAKLLIGKLAQDGMGEVFDRNPRRSASQRVQAFVVVDDLEG